MDSILLPSMHPVPMTYAVKALDGVFLTNEANRV
jgi:hypothetical protein